MPKREGRVAHLRMCAVLAGLAIAFPANWTAAQKRPAQARTVKASAEYAPASETSLAALEVGISGAAAESPARHAVTDARLFISKSGGSVSGALAAGNGEALPDGARALFNVRLFIVAGGRLYTGARAQCGPWESDVSRCQASCEGGTFALRRKGAAELELLVGAVPGGPAGAGPGLTISDCGLEDDADATLGPKGGRGLAVAGFGHD